jgi:hypothetical protein
MSDITFASSTMLLSLNISIWSGNKLDKGETADVRTRTGARQGAVRVHKSLLPDAQELLDLKRHATAVREFFNARTAPWAGDMRIMRSDAYLEFSQALADHRQQFNALVEKLIAAYGLRVDEARGRLGTMFDAHDYPSPTEIRRAHSFAIRVAPTPSVKDWRLDLNDTVMDDLRRDLEEQSTSALHGALADVAARIADVARKAHERLSDPNGIFRDSLIGNIDELVGLLPILNVANDPQLDDLATNLRLSVFGVTPEVLRAGGQFRADKAQELGSLAANAEALADLFGGAR